MTDVRADLFEFSLPLSSPLRTARGEIASREGFLVRLAIDGVPGIGEAAPLPGWTESRAECRAALLDAVERFSDLDEPDALGALADAPAARHAFSLALLDLRATHEDAPLSRYLSRDGRVDSVPVNATIGDGSAAETVAAAEDAVDAGYDCLKCKVGARSVEEDAARAAAVRDAVGADVKLRFDANAAWTREEARAALPRLADADPDYVEQPLSAADLAGHADLREETAVPIALDESLATNAADEILEADAADVFVLKPVALGGIAEAHGAAEAAREAGVEPVVTTTVDGVVARTAAVHLAAAIPQVSHCGLATADLLAVDLGPDPAPVENGSVRVPRDPGLGVTVTGESEHVSEIVSYR